MFYTVESHLILLTSWAISFRALVMLATELKVFNGAIETNGLLWP